MLSIYHQTDLDIADLLGDADELIREGKLSFAWVMWNPHKAGNVPTYLPEMSTRWWELRFDAAGIGRETRLWRIEFSEETLRSRRGKDLPDEVQLGKHPLGGWAVRLVGIDARGEAWPFTFAERLPSKRNSAGRLFRDPVDVWECTATRERDGFTAVKRWFPHLNGDGRVLATEGIPILPLDLSPRDLTEAVKRARRIFRWLPRLGRLPGRAITLEEVQAALGQMRAKNKRLTEKNLIIEMHADRSMIQRTFQDAGTTLRDTIQRLGYGYA